MTRTNTFVLATSLLAGLGWTGLSSAGAAPDVDIWKAAASGNIDCELAKKGILDRVSISPGETKVCFEYQTGFKNSTTGRTLYIAEFDAKKPSITNAKPFANAKGANRWFAYPRWTKDETAIVYHASPSLYMYKLADASTVQVSTKEGADYRYPHCEATPK